VSAPAIVIDPGGTVSGDSFLDGLLTLAEEARLRGDYRTGVAHARLAVDRADALGEPAGRARARRSLANQLLRLGGHEDAIGACRDAIAIMEGLGDEEGICWELTVQALAFTELGLFEEALEGLSRSRDIALRRVDRGLLYWVHNRTGVVHSSMGDHLQANTHLLNALSLAGDLDVEARFCILNNLGDNAIGLVPALRAAGRLADADAALAVALDHCAQALDLARAAAHPFRTSISLDNYGMVLGLAGTFPAAFAALEESLSLALSHGYLSLQSSALQHRARVHLLSGDAERAIDGLLVALERALDAGEVPTAMAAHQELCGAYEQVGDFRAALSHHRSFHALERESCNGVAAARARVMTHHFELDNARLEADNARLEAELHRIRSRELEADKQALQIQVQEDALTGLANRRGVDVRLPGLLSRPLCVAVADVDLFKGVNDQFGHPVGDEVLRQIAVLLREGLRGDDFVARLGGEEFLVALADTTPEQAFRACQQLRARIAAHPWDRVAPGLRVTVSFGLSAHRGGTAHTDLLERADAALYAAKRNGRNRVEVG